MNSVFLEQFLQSLPNNTPLWVWWHRPITLGATVKFTKGLPEMDIPRVSQQFKGVWAECAFNVNGKDILKETVQRILWLGQDPPSREEKRKYLPIRVMIGSRHQRGLVEKASSHSLVRWELVETPLDISWSKVQN